jgi:hypothetical protein
MRGLMKLFWSKIPNDLPALGDHCPTVAGAMQWGDWLTPPVLLCEGPAATEQARLGPHHLQPPPNVPTNNSAGDSATATIHLIDETGSRNGTRVHGSHAAMQAAWQRGDPACKEGSEHNAVTRDAAGNTGGVTFADPFSLGPGLVVYGAPAAF